MRVNVDGTYDIEYDDGDVERRVRKSLVRKLEVHQKVDIKNTMILMMIMSFRVVIASAKISRKVKMVQGQDYARQLGWYI